MSCTVYTPRILIGDLPSCNTHVMTNLHLSSTRFPQAQQECQQYDRYPWIKMRNNALDKAESVGTTHGRTEVPGLLVFVHDTNNTTRNNIVIHTSCSPVRLGNFLFLQLPVWGERPRLAGQGAFFMRASSSSRFSSLITSMMSLISVLPRPARRQVGPTTLFTADARSY